MLTVTYLTPRFFSAVDNAVNPDRNLNGQTFDGTRPYSVTSGRYVKQGELDFGDQPMSTTMANSDYNAFAGYNGEPLSCHITFATEENRHGGLASPAGVRIRRGDFTSMNVSYWGSNSCRAGWAASSADDLPPPAQDYVKEFAGIYFEAMNQWFALLRIGQTGDVLSRVIQTKLPFEKFGIYLNAGHLIHLDEWVSSPIFPGSMVPIHSGMAMQVDVIPSSATYCSTRMEDGVVIAGRDLQEKLRLHYPACFSRCLGRREFMRNTLGIEVNDDVLPLSNMPAIVPPYFLSPNRILVLRN